MEFPAGLSLPEVDANYIRTHLAPALLKYQVLYFPEGNMNNEFSPQQQLEFTRSFPDVDQSLVDKDMFAPDAAECLPGLPAVRFLGSRHGDAQLRKNIIPETYMGNREWHADGLGITTMVCDEMDPAARRPRCTEFCCGFSAYDMQRRPERKGADD